MTYKDVEMRREYARTWMANRRREWIESQGRACVKCGSEERLEVDHIDPSKKTMNPTRLWSRRAETREAELANCQVLCHECHRAKTTERPLVHGTSNAYEIKACRCVECRGWNSARQRRTRANLAAKLDRPVRSVGRPRKEQAA